ncbi:STAS domain-containing protein [Stutzerimonas nitrititolerans]|uniref:STAS domain-containing protein n=1 Tax=Stutzerimonas nitrititolerans TaxID=2482751 RepID=UPI0028AD5AA6|nr:STAS domain-containing protein [Stutzerimonas nitrititolerans]
MSCEIDVVAEGRTSLVGELCVFHAAELKPRLLALATSAGEQEIDLAQVSEVDTAGVQLLLLARREAAGAGGRLRYVNHSAPVLEALMLLNLAAELGDPASIAVKEGAPL